MFEPALNQRSSILSHILLAKSQNMKKVFNIALLSLAYLCGFGQQNNLTLQFWGSDGKRVGNEKKAKFVTTVQKINDTCWEHQHYQMKGPMIWSAQFKDKEGKVRHGRSSFMQTSGLLDSTGYFANSIPHGEWRYFDNNGNLITKKTTWQDRLYLSGKSTNRQPRILFLVNLIPVPRFREVQLNGSGTLSATCAIPITQSKIKLQEAFKSTS